METPRSKAGFVPKLRNVRVSPLLPKNRFDATGALSGAGKEGAAAALLRGEARRGYFILPHCRLAAQNPARGLSSPNAAGSAPRGDDRRLLPARLPSLLCHLLGALPGVPAPCLCRAGSERFPVPLSCRWPGTVTFNRYFTGQRAVSFILGFLICRRRCAPKEGGGAGPD